MCVSSVESISSNVGKHANDYSLEWWSFELIILISGLLPNPQLETSVLSIW